MCEPAELPRLNEYSKEEWWDVCRRCNPTITHEEFEVLWEEFFRMKARKEMH